MGRPLRVLVVAPLDAADQIVLALRRGDIDATWERVETADGLQAALSAGPGDAVLSAYTLPGFGAAAALALVRMTDPNLPFVVVADALGADAAAELMRAGANDCVTTPARLPVAVEREVRAAAARRERQAADWAAAQLDGGPATGRNLDEQFRQAQKMETVGRLAGGVAHDFNNLLTVINGCSELLLQSLPPGDPARELAAEIHKAGERSAGLTRQLLTFSRPQALAPREIDLNAVVADTGTMLRWLVGEGVQLVTAPAPGLWAVRADPGQIGQVLMNLAANARDAMPRGGRLTVETRNVELDAEYARTDPEACPGPHVVLSVSDTGTGMPPAVKARIFEPFFTTKEPGRGTGLGLATVAGIVRRCGGHVAVASEPGAGTTVRVYLPRADKPAAPPDAPPDDPGGYRVPPRGAETVLIAEDEDRVRALTHRVLAGCGYTVLEAADGGEAARVAARHAGPIHLLIADVVLPGASGRAVAARVAERHPAVRVLFVSGHTDDAVVRNEVCRDGANFLEKPFSPLALAVKVRGVLDAPAIGA